MSTITAKDLTKDFPRSPYDQIAGIPWLPRLIDKVRALGAGKIGEYTPFPCGGDQNFLGTVGVDATAIKAEIDRGASDEEIATWVKAHAAPDHQEKLVSYNAMQRTAIADGEYLGWLNGAKAELAKVKPDLDLSKATNFSELICLEEGHTVPA